MDLVLDGGEALLLPLFFLFSFRSRGVGALGCLLCFLWLRRGGEGDGVGSDSDSDSDSDCESDADEDSDPDSEVSDSGDGAFFARFVFGGGGDTTRIRLGAGVRLAAGAEAGATAGATAVETVAGAAALRAVEGASASFGTADDGLRSGGAVEREDVVVLDS